MNIFKFNLLKIQCACLAFYAPLALHAGLVDDHEFSEEEKAWWAVQPLQSVAPPEAGEGWAKNEVDHFIAAKLAAEKLQPAAEADRYELVRRAYFDLHGLPPSPEQVAAFVADERPDAWGQLIEQLLASPRYGERWAQHWLDVVRYAETDGYRADHFRPGAYHYRDYVIRAFNEDKPYDQLIREQLAADEMGITDPKTLIATAFLRHGIYEHNQRNARMHWELILDEMTRVTGEAFLGLGIGCAQCHDHKFDPILQKDYYALQSFLATTAWPMDRKLATPEQIAAYEDQLGEWEAATEIIREAMDGMLKSAIESKARYAVKQFPEEIQEMYHKAPEDRTPYEQQMVYLVQRQVDDQLKGVNGKSAFKKDEAKLAEYEELAELLAEYDALMPRELPTAFVVADVGTQPVPTYIASRKGKVEVAPSYLTLLGQPAPEIKATDRSTGRRLTLAKWIAQPDNMLTTRVAVNRIWQHHFSRGIVATPNDFGTLGEKPTHPELLDWLARRFVDQGWKLKPMHRLLMNSATYQQTARREAPEIAAKHDPENTWLWRYPPRRLSAEQVRDAMLSVSGALQHRDGGPSRDGTSPVRSIYVTKKRNSPDPVLAAFDAPQGFDSAPARLETATPTQSLLLSNNPWPLARARGMAQRLTKGQTAVTPEMIDAAYAMAFARKPAAAERQAALNFVSTQAKTIQQLPKPVPKPASGGYELVSNAFKGLGNIGLGKHALKLQRSGSFSRLHIKNKRWLDDHFTVEAVVRLNSVYESASVNTIVSRWTGSQSEAGGWSLGVTSNKSAYEPRNVIMQLVGEDVAGNVSYAVVDSNLQAPLNAPLYVAASVDLEPGKSGMVTFYLKDLSDPKNPMQVSVVKHPITQHIQQPGAKLIVGGRDQGASHTWDGSLARLVITEAVLTPDALIAFAPHEPAKRVFDFVFDADTPIPDSAWLSPQAASTKSNAAPSHVVDAMTDFCHALLISNEFLYLH